MEGGEPVAGISMTILRSIDFEQSAAPHSPSWAGCQGGVGRPRYCRDPAIRWSVSESKEKRRRQKECSKTCARKRVSRRMCARGTRRASDPTG